MSGFSGVDQSAWTAYTPTFSAASGTITTAAAAGRWKQIGKTVNFTARLIITTNGTGAVAINLGLPTAAQGIDPGFYVVGRENGVTGGFLIGYFSSTTNVQIFTTALAYPGQNSAIIAISGSYEGA